jgi:chromosome segregation ATPase
MATKNGVELSFSISDKEATTALRELSSNITMMNKELGLTNEKLKADNASIDDYKSKVSLLSKEKASLSEKIAKANGMLEKAKETYGDSSKETQKWQ